MSERGGGWGEESHLTPRLHSCWSEGYVIIWRRCHPVFQQWSSITLLADLGGVWAPFLFVRMDPASPELSATTTLYAVNTSREISGTLCLNLHLLR